MINLSKRQLTSYEESLLSKGLSFVPSKEADEFTTKVELFKFCRSVKLKAFFTKDNNQPPFNRPVESTVPTVSQKRFRPKSTFVPQVMNSSVNTFCRLVNHDVSALFSDGSNRCYPNLSIQERQALAELRKDDSIVIRKADKGGAIVLQDKESYCEEIQRQLSNTVYYARLNGDPTIKFSKEIKLTLDKALADQNITKDEYSYMLREHSVRPHFQTLPKVHKSLHQPVPGRPLVSTIGSLTEPISQYLDYHIRDSVLKLPSYLRDTADFLNKLGSIGDIIESDILCTADITALYTNVPQKEGLEALEYYMSRRVTQTPPVDLLIDLAKVVLNKNFFKFEKDYYLQIHGVSMGSNFSPMFSNLFAGKFEEDFVYNNNPFSTHLKCWFRFIDDIFFVYSGSDDMLTQFMGHLNSRLPSIKFTLEASRQSVPFLDVLVTKSEIMHTTVYRKPTDRNNFLHSTSYHPASLKKGLPYSQMLRLKRICSTESELNKHARDLCDRFRAKGYSEKILTDSLSRAEGVSRASLLTPKPPQPSNPPMVLSTTFSPISQQVKAIVRKHWHILSSDPAVGATFATPPIFANKRARNLRDALVKNETYNPPQHFLSTLPSGNFPCNNCVHCNAMIKNDFVLHPHTGKKYSVRGRFCCLSKMCVYLLKCPCGLCYVGKTTRELKTRVSEHKSSIRLHDEKSPVARHFNAAGHGVCDLRFQGIELVKPMRRGGDRGRLLLQREAYWQFLLNTESPKGLNESLSLSCFL